MIHDFSHSYTRNQRIIKTDEFSSVFYLRPTCYVTHFKLYVRNNKLQLARLGIIITKRLAPRAVTRNTIKRISRELFRQTILPQVDYIILLFRPINTKHESANNTKLKTTLHQELSQLFSLFLKFNNYT